MGPSQESTHVKAEPEEPHPEGASLEDRALGTQGWMPRSPGSKEKPLFLPSGGRRRVRFLGETFWGELRALLREGEAPDFHVHSGSLRVGDWGASWPGMLAALRTLSSCSSSLTLGSCTFPSGKDQRTAGGCSSPHCLVPGKCPLRVPSACLDRGRTLPGPHMVPVFPVIGTACDSRVLPPVLLGPRQSCPLRDELRVGTMWWPELWPCTRKCCLAPSHHLPQKAAPG